MTKFQVGDKVKVLMANGCGVPVGEVVEVVLPDYAGAFVKYQSRFSNEPFISNQKLELVVEEPKKPTKNQRISALEKEVAELKKVVEEIQLHNPKQVDLPQWSEPVVSTSSLRETVLNMAGKALDRQLRESVLPQSNNQKRAAIIEKAKRFVEEVKNDSGFYDVDDTRISDFPWQCIADFVVNDQKRTVVALMKGFEVPEIYARGIAKCHPHDVFNEYIGKAIALGRALGLDVSEFTQAVQPDEVVVGMEVATTRDYPESVDGPVRKGDVFKIVKGKLKESNQALLGSSISENCRITNDTNAQYEEVK